LRGQLNVRAARQQGRWDQPAGTIAGQKPKAEADRLVAITSLKLPLGRKALQQVLASYMPFSNLHQYGVC
jgi:hypothetical protein